ncbi:Cytochrome P450, E-class, group I [Penicillium expansum]|uniref:Cytochrome P450, E-class, group I n=1 Tax=Penicillium expansum TaxID=27334 RepID=A0A0A2I9I1_PENEN|nr:Cytochrome P450, E-class, group I [Penicillium expansum]KGO39078.1 Cytochrome P450, E-class, group I [Penicillium expansum]KGO49399.1 Cytochrome P450, E-class, group I [Penicillium expansum]KGO63875.1 Cytochrome P450, E-class, group I [Penicillium expansum]
MFELSPVAFSVLGPVQTISLAIGLVFLGYISYMSYFHTLSQYPGPKIASLTSLWRAYYVYKLVLHEKLVKLHQQYGPVVRIGPNHLHFWDGEAIAPIYKGGRKMGKTQFYDAFTAFNPNLFGGRDEDIHSLRRRQLAHGFSQTSVENFEPLINGHIEILLNKLNEFAKTGEVFDLKSTISYFVLDILGEVAFSRPFNAQARGEADEIHAINDHLLLSCVIGELPFQALSKFLARWSPVPWMRKLGKSRNNLKETCSECVRNKINNVSDRRDLLKSLVTTKDVETGASLTEQEINSEAFAMLVAGSHSTSGTLTLLFWHLIHNPEICATVAAEVASTLQPLQDGDISYPIKGLEASLPYTMACVRENFRLNPVFTMPLWRSVGSPSGARIGDFDVPCGTNVCISNYVLHHNPEIWGEDHAVFRPDRWLEKDEPNRSRCLIPFSIGHRMCIGRNLAMTNILKTVTTLISQFEFHPISQDDHVRVRSSGIGEMEGSFQCKVSVKC